MARRWMRSTVFALAFMASATTALAQTTPPAGSGQTKPSTGAQKGIQARQGSATDKAYVQQMLIANMAEVQLGQMAGERATSADVKSYAQTMVADHTKANEQLMPLAQSLGVQQPAQLDAKHKAIADRLSKLQGAEFDREFMRTMVTSHQAVVKQTRSMAPAGSKTGAAGTKGAAGTAGSGSTAGAGSASPTTAREYAAATLPIVQQHLEHAQQVAKTVSKGAK